MLDPGNAQHMATYPALSFPKHNTPSPQRWKGLHLHHKRKPCAQQRYSQRVSNQAKRNHNSISKHFANTTATNYSYFLPRRDIHLIKIKYCEDTRPLNQLNATKEQNKDLYNILQGASVTLQIILLSVGGTIYTTRTLKPFKELGLDSQRVKKLASKLHVHSVHFAAKLVHTRRALSSTVINSHQEPVSGQARNPPDPH